MSLGSLCLVSQELCLALYTIEGEKHKTQALKSSRSNFDTHMSLSQAAIEELHWWVASLPTAYNEISNGTPDIVINTDASLKGVGEG